MKKVRKRIYSRYSRDAGSLLGHLIRSLRKQRKLSSQELAERAGISRGLLQRIEKGDPRCSIGTVFEVASIVGVQLFDADHITLKKHLRQTEEKLLLLPKSIRKRNEIVDDDF